MPYSLEQDVKLIQIQSHIDKLLIMLKDHLKNATHTEIMAIKRELTNSINQKFNEMKNKH